MISHLGAMISVVNGALLAHRFKQITGTEGDFKLPWKKDHEAFLESLPERAKSIGKELLPFSLTGNQFVLSNKLG